MYNHASGTQYLLPSTQLMINYHIFNRQSIVEQLLYDLSGINLNKGSANTNLADYHSQ